jgi:hypothetical protein
VEVPNKTTQPPIGKKRGRSTSKRQDVIAGKQKMTTNANQLLVDAHLEDIQGLVDSDPQSSSAMRINTEARTSKDPRSIVSGGYDESLRVDEIVINFTETGESYNRESIIVDIYFSKQIANILLIDSDPKSMAECKKHSDWDKWKVAIETEIASLNKRKVFSAVMPTPPGIFPMGYKWVFIRKRNENNKVVRYKASLVAQGFTQRPGVDFNETYSPVMSGITFRYLISLAVQNRLSMQLMDIMTAYLYGSLDYEIYMIVPDGISIPNPKANCNMYCVKL